MENKNILEFGADAMKEAAKLLSSADEEQIQKLLDEKKAAVATTEEEAKLFEIGVRYASAKASEDADEVAKQLLAIRTLLAELHFTEEEISTILCRLDA